MTRLRAAALALMLSTGLAACTGTTTPPTSTAGGTRTVVDMEGRSVQVPMVVTRVATNYPALPASIYLLGDVSDVVGATPQAFNSLFETIDPAVKSIPNLFPTASTVDTEALLAARPQVILTSPAAGPLLPTFARLGIPVLEFAAFQSPAALEAGLNLLAQVFGGPALARAHAYSAFYDANVTAVTQRTSGLPASERPTVFYATQGPTTTEGLGSIVTVWIDEGGGSNVAATNGVGPIKGAAFPTISLETLLRWNPDYIVTLGSALVHTYETDPRYATLAAVRDHHVLSAPIGVFPWAVRSVESALQPLWIAKTLHPQLFGALDLGSAVQDFYSKFYSYNLSPSQVSTILSGEEPI